MSRRGRTHGGQQTNVHPGRGENTELRDRIAELEAKVRVHEAHDAACADIVPELFELRALRDEVLAVCSAPPALEVCAHCSGQRVRTAVDAELNVLYIDCATCAGHGVVVA